MHEVPPKAPLGRPGPSRRRRALSRALTSVATIGLVALIAALIVNAPGGGQSPSLEGGNAAAQGALHVSLLDRPATASDAVGPLGRPLRPDIAAATLRFATE